LSAMACVGPNQMSFVGGQGGCFVTFHGTKNGTGAGNSDDALLYYDFASGVYTPILDGGTNGVGHIDTIIVSGTELILGEFAAAGWVDYNYGPTGSIDEFDLGSQSSSCTPEPGAWGLTMIALLAAAVWRSQCLQCLGRRDATRA
jgi:hypothetical protein